MGKDWKDNLLSSGLPLEHVVSTILEKNKIYSYGEYSYLRKKDKGVETERSIDINAATIIPSSCWFHFLIECKYCHQSVKWFFPPISKGRREHNLLEYGLIKFFEELCSSRIDYTGFARFESALDLCSRGVEIHLKEKTDTTIKDGLYKLRYALPNKATEIVKRQLDARGDEDLNIELLIPILLTTAPLYIINHEADVNSIQKAKDVNEISANVDSLVVYQEPSIDLEEYTEILFKNISKHPSFITRLKELNTLLNEHTSNKYFLDLDLHSNFKRLPAKILVVNLDAFDKVIKKLLNIFKRSIKNYDKFAVLKSDWEEHKSFSETKTWFEKYEPNSLDDKKNMNNK